MGFKVDASFLRYLTMGALASQRVMQLMAHAGLQPVVLERYSAANKIWSTKVKRLRLPDLLCVKTGVRIEVRGKSKLAIRMSDAPANEARRWFTGLRPDDLVAFVHCPGNGSGFAPAASAEFFWVRDLQATESQTKLGPPKSAGEGSERDREWSTIVSSRPGQVTEVTAEMIRTVQDSGRKQNYPLRGMQPYVQTGDRFLGDCQFIAGVPKRRASLRELAEQAWDPRTLLSGGMLDQYVAAKALGVVGTGQDVALLRHLYDSAVDPRVSLESAGSLTKLGAPDGLERLLQEIQSPRTDYLRMEAVLLLSELSGTPLRDEAAAALSTLATQAEFSGNEIRQAAIWGLGCTGLRAYSSLIPLLDAEDDNERIHAVVALGRDLPAAIVDRLLELLSLDSSSVLLRASCAHVLIRLEHPQRAIVGLKELATTGSRLGRAWAKAALGSMPPEQLRGIVEDPELLSDILATQLLSEHSNWTSTEETWAVLSFTQKQTVCERH